MSDPYHNPEKFGLRIEYQADAGSSYEFDKLVIWSYVDKPGLLLGTDAGCSCPSPFEGHGLSDLEVATPEAVGKWFDSKFGRVSVGERQKALAIFEKNMDIDKEIAEAENKLESLKLRKARLTQRTPEQQVADAMHAQFCHSNHTDGCSWEYETKNGVDDWNLDTHFRWVEKARRFIDELSDEGDALQALHILRSLGKALNQ